MNLKPRLVGYARVSTDTQNLAPQLMALKALGCDPIFTDHGVSGAQRDRPGLKKALRALNTGDKLVVWRLDRLGRSLSHLIVLLDDLNARNVMFQSLTELIDTNSSSGRLVFHMMAALAEFERSLISERTKIGMAAAKSQGFRLGRRPKIDEECSLKMRQLRQQGWSIAELAIHYGVHKRTVERSLQRK
ncbi:recombinase family protein [Achromobacter sp. DH1f]|uniref:recombinase family protein n=1 Tax=Achromobacter sp. DH1f TaxID=1397275 RepID=UPI002100CB58|nr:recombinase family protein [Achromobacter sp. DH1f]